MSSWNVGMLLQFQLQESNISRSMMRKRTAWRVFRSSICKHEIGHFNLLTVVHYSFRFFVCWHVRKAGDDAAYAHCARFQAKQMYFYVCRAATGCTSLHVKCKGRDVGSLR
jgi:hypothetical protein